jgi:hypothetical protein
MLSDQEINIGRLASKDKKRQTASGLHKAKNQKEASMNDSR